MGHRLFIVSAIGCQIVLSPLQRLTDSSHVAMTKNRPTSGDKGDTFFVHLGIDIPH